jgi:hypothetical protein
METTIHDPCEWAEQPQHLQPAVTIRSAGGGSVVRMVCPRCGGVTLSRIMSVVPGPGGHKGRPGSDEPPPDPRPRLRTFICTCGLPHPGRPGNAMDQGCGAYWKAEV